MEIFNQLPSSILQASAIFLSIIIEALPFVLIGSVLSGFIDSYLTPEIVLKVLPKNRFLSIILGSLLGLVFPSCECGIVPIVNHFMEKKVPSYTAIPFMATAPVINPIVMFATYSAFGNSWHFVWLRVLGVFLISLSMGVFLAFYNKDYIQLPHHHCYSHSHHHPQNPWKKFANAWIHAIDEFFDVGRYLVFGCAFASLMQVYIPTKFITNLASTPLLAILIFMIMAFILSLCSEADAFIAASFLSSFGVGPIIAFLVIGPLVDIKNLLMMKNSFKSKFIGQFVGISSLIVILYAIIIGGF